MSDSTAAISGTLSDKDRLAVETLYRAFSEHDPALLDTVVSEDWQDLPPAPGQPAGRAGTKFLVGGFSAAFPDSKVTVREIIGAPGRAAVRAEITATHLARSRPIESQGISFWRRVGFIGLAGWRLALMKAYSIDLRKRVRVSVTLY